MVKPLDFEKPIVELEQKIEELKQFTAEREMDLSDEIKKLENKSSSLKREIFGNLTAWQRTQIARHVDRPTAMDYINKIFDNFIELHGDRLYGEDKSIVGGIAKLNGKPVTVVGHMKGKDTKENISRNFGMPHPEGYRKAIRLMKQAEKFNRPIVCLVDTPGAYCGIGAEERGQSIAIAESIQKMSNLTVPIVVVVIGEGGSGGALALGVGDKILMLENSIYSVISPEGASTILWKDATKAQEAAEALQITAHQLKELNIIDQIIEEPLGGAHKDPGTTAENIKKAINLNLENLHEISSNDLVEERYNKLRKMGDFVAHSN
ncbi:acetyl-CoA carboxylase carboxyl transferase subunit alpha [Desulfitispora alkaliphila]|uniref:acetyl-CoA carboxylase carboxyltransferase subunit alpha n=1 Tax=Desulfitispora alkaliphila TaxID=622674 RepID=UPI003D1E1663